MYVFMTNLKDVMFTLEACSFQVIQDHICMQVIHVQVIHVQGDLTDWFKFARLIVFMHLMERSLGRQVTFPLLPPLCCGSGTWAPYSLRNQDQDVIIILTE